MTLTLVSKVEYLNIKADESKWTEGLKIRKVSFILEKHYTCGISGNSLAFLIRHVSLRMLVSFAFKLNSVDELAS